MCRKGGYQRPSHCGRWRVGQTFFLTLFSTEIKISNHFVTNFCGLSGRMQRREDVSHLRHQDRKKRKESKNSEVRQKLCWKRNRLVKFISEVVLLLKYSRMGAVRICLSALDIEADGRVFSNIAAIVKCPSFAPDEHLIYWRRAVGSAYIPWTRWTTLHLQLPTRL